MSGVVLFQHGLGGGEAQVSENWCGARGFTRITHPCRGHDDMPLGTDRPFSIPMFAEDVLKAADGVDRFCAAGISMGAAIALHLACHHPDRVGALVLVRPAWTFSAAPENMQPVVEIAKLLKRHTPREAAARFETGEIGGHLAWSSPDNYKSLVGYTERANASGFADVLHDIATGDPGICEARAACLRVPCLIICSDEDVIHPAQSAEVLARTIPAARLVRVTPKSVAKDLHQSEVRAAISVFLAEHFRSFH